MPTVFKPGQHHTGAGNNLTGLLAPPCLALERRTTACSARVCQCAPRPPVSCRANKAECMLCTVLLLQFSWAVLKERPEHQFCSHRGERASTCHNKHASERTVWSLAGSDKMRKQRAVVSAFKWGLLSPGSSQEEDERLNGRADAREPRTQGNKASKHRRPLASELVYARTSVDRCVTRRKTSKLLALLSLVTITYS